MSVCDWCNLEMTEADDCPNNRTIEYPDETTLPAIPYIVDWIDHEGADMRFYVRCHDCNVAVGQYHHPGCDMERCPKCTGQLISCGCLDTDDEEDDEQDL